MPEQQTLTGTADVGEGGLWRRYVERGRVDHANWLRARAEGHAVGTCRRCGGNLMPERPDEHAGGRLDYSATCRACGWTIVAPGGRVMYRSARWSVANGAGRAAALARQHKEEP